MHNFTLRLRQWHHEHYLFIPLYVFLPALFLLTVPAAAKLGWQACALGWLAGLFLWTFIEYLLHRFVFHYEAKSVWAKKIVLYCHGYHHQAPAETRRAVMIMSLPAAAVLLLLFHLALPAAWANILFSGTITGYLAYDGFHYALHHQNFKSRLGRALKTYHMRHHGREHARGFGVTSPLWDVVFRTRP